jgi:protein-tyrosine phosphatase
MDEVSNWRRDGISAVVSFLTPEEVKELGLEAEKEHCEANEIQFISFEIPDRGVPASVSETTALVRDLEQRLSRGETIALHCRQSVGRSGLIAAYLLVDSGDDPPSAFERIGASRGIKVPETESQERWLNDRATEYRRTNGERLFEAYLRSQGITDIRFQGDQPGRKSKPEYIVRIDSIDYLFEIKELKSADLLRAGSADPVKLITKKINEGRSLFKGFETWPCSVVLYDEGLNLVDRESPELMIKATDNETAESESNPPILSAVITLRYVEIGQRKLAALHNKLTKDTQGVVAKSVAESEAHYANIDPNERRLGVIVFDNLNAKFPLPRNLFSGLYDERYVREAGIMKRIFAGSELAALQELEQSTAALRED